MPPDGDHTDVESGIPESIDWAREDAITAQKDDLGVVPGDPLRVDVGDELEVSSVLAAADELAGGRDRVGYFERELGTRRDHDVIALSSSTRSKQQLQVFLPAGRTALAVRSEKVLQVDGQKGATRRKGELRCGCHACQENRRATGTTRR